MPRSGQRKASKSGVTTAQARPRRRQIEHVPVRDRWWGVMHGIWDLYSKQPDLAPILLPRLVRDPVPEVRAGALYGLRETSVAAKYLREFRLAARSDLPVVRDAGVYGLDKSASLKDERLLWRLLWHDQFREIQYGAASALKGMARDLNARQYAKAVTSHPMLRIRLILAERSIRDKKLRKTARHAIRESFAAFEREGTLNYYEDRDLFRELRLQDLLATPDSGLVRKRS